MGSLIAAPGDDPKPPTSHTTQPDASGPGPQVPAREASPGATSDQDDPPMTPRQRRAHEHFWAWIKETEERAGKRDSRPCRSAARMMCEFFDREVLMLRRGQPS